MLELVHSASSFINPPNTTATRSGLALQGGPLTDRELEDFLATPYAQEALCVRRWDDLAKTPGRATSTLAHFITIARSACAIDSNLRR